MLQARNSCSTTILAGCRILSHLTQKEVDGNGVNTFEICDSTHDQSNLDGLRNQNIALSEGQHESRTNRHSLRPCNMPLCLFPKRSYSTSHPHHHKPSGKTYYEILGVTPQCSKAKIKQAYYRLSKVYHPDINKTEAAHNKFQEISEAYEVLFNVHKRQQYDKDHRKRAHHGTEKGTRFGQQRYKSKGTPPTGRSSVYNFDEWYKQHYQETLDRDYEDRMKRRRFENVVKEEEKFSHGGDSDKAIQVVGLTACIIALVMFILKR